MPICAIIFDLDGVLINSAEAHRQSWKLLGESMDVSVSDEDIDKVFGRQNRDIIPILFGDDLAPEQVRELGQRKEELYRESVRGRVPAMDGAVALIQHYADNGYQLAIGSSTPRANIELALSEMQVLACFEEIVSSEDVAVGKPDPTVFLTAASRLGVAPGDCMVIEDAPAGVEAARSAGMPVVALLGSYPVEKLRNASRVIRHLNELIPKDVASV